MEKTYSFKQSAIVEHLDDDAARKMFGLSLDFGPYSLDYSRNGKYIALAGRRGHLAMFDWKESKLKCEIQVAETVRDVAFLHNETLFAVAQRRHVYIYDQQGIEVHHLRDHIDPTHLEYLSYHWLLVAMGKSGYLKYQDTSTGKMVCEHATRKGRAHSMAQNPHNAIIHLGHTNGTVTLWSPNMSEPLVKMLCHRTAISAICVDPRGQCMVTAGLDSTVRVWDLRTYKEMDTYGTDTTVTSLSASQRGLVAMGMGARAVIWKDLFQGRQQAPYMTHRIRDSVTQDVQFVPYDDILGIGHRLGFSSIVVPGSGEPNFDSYVANPYETATQRRETEVHALLEKLMPSTIALDPSTVGSMDRASVAVRNKERDAVEAEAKANRAKVREKKKTKGRSKSARKFKSKQQNVIDEKRMMIREQQAKREKEQKEQQQRNASRAK
eukprot:TRINITY_DN4248_c0_g1_i1.p1 TRINITY_DN4248_c0_g1~~TRINITY_DN4248_c0_g1_i1.p1  ORF type:complete len:514 (-),score=111.68 TRINITY_DN4248_c0_g1_i1:6-1316(-)